MVEPFVDVDFRFRFVFVYSSPCAANIVAVVGSGVGPRFDPLSHRGLGLE